jgi:hypothetical protein
MPTIVKFAKQLELEESWIMNHNHHHHEKVLVFKFRRITTTKWIAQILLILSLKKNQM